MASAGTALAGLPAPGVPLPATVTGALTTGQTSVLTTVLNRLIPAEKAMPAAGALGIAGFIDATLVAAPHLRQDIFGVLAALPSADELGRWSDDALEARLREIEREQPKAFDLLLQATYTGYYRHPRVLAALGGVESDQQGERRLDCFYPETDRGPRSTDA